MKTKILYILSGVILTFTLQSCGEMPIESQLSGGNNESVVLTPGIEEGLCEETHEDFIFKIGKPPHTTNQRFKKGNGIIEGPDGTIYEEVAQTKIAEEQTILNKSYACTMEVSEDGKEIIFTAIAKTAPPPPRKYRSTTRGTALVN